MATKKEAKATAVKPNFLVQQIRVYIAGLNPGLLTDNGHLADPSSDSAVLLGKLRDQAKTSADARKQYAEQQLIARSYFDEEGYVTIPSQMLQAAFIAAVAKAGVKTKEIAKVKSGIAVLDNAEFYVNGERATQEDLENNKFAAIVTNAGGGGKSVIYRPHYKNWTAIVPVEIEADLLDADLLQNIVNAAGRYVGIGCWRPSSKKAGKHGRFVVTKLEIVE